jgi:UDP-N-acetylglucosamine--dolichyl-phosphate N-acetylglucosaminephosphotransferase
VGLCQLIMKVSGGITERKLVLTLMGIEAIFGTIAVLVYVVR